ncbi:MAG: DUF3857 domain-containing protein [Bacteroidota bacterium]
MRVYISIALILLAELSFAQSKLFKELTQKYPDQNAVFNLISRNIEIEPEGDSLKILLTQEEEIVLLKDQAKALAKDKIHLSHFIELVDLEAKTYVPVKSKYEEASVTDFKEKSEQSSGIFFDDSKSIGFIYPAVEQGAKLYKKYTQRITDPHFLTSFYLGSFLPAERINLSIKVHKDITLGFKEFKLESSDTKVEVTNKGDYKIYTWSRSDVEAFEFEEDAPSLNYTAPHVIYHIKSAVIGNQRRNVLSNPGDLYRLYSSFLERMDKAESNELKKLVSELTSNAKSDKEKAENIFYWVQDNINYIAFEDGMRGFIPHNAEYTLDKKYGDCKDMACITKTMLDLAGIESYFTWIGSRDLPYNYSEVPTPIVDNHMIAAYKSGDEYVFLDATGKHTALGLPSAFIQGKEALISLDDESFEIIKVPIVDKEVNFKFDSVHFSILNEKIEGQGKLELGGYEKIYATYRLTGRNEEASKKIVTSLTEKGNNKYFVEEFGIENLDSKKLELSVDYSFTIEDYFNIVGDEIYFNMNLNKEWFNEQIDLSKRHLPIENDYKYFKKYVSVIDIPDGYDLTYLPESTSEQNEDIGFTMEYERVDNKVIMRKTLYADFLILNPDDFSNWNKVVEKLNEAYRDVIILEKSV